MTWSSITSSCTSTTTRFGAFASAFALSMLKSVLKTKMIAFINLFAIFNRMSEAMHLKQIAFILVCIFTFVAMVKQGKKTIQKIGDESVKTEEITVEVAPTPVVGEIVVNISGEASATADTADEVPSASIDLVIPTKVKNEKENAVSVKVLLKDGDAVSEVFKTEMKNTSKERKQEMVKEMTDEIKDLLMKREFLLEGVGSTKKKDDKTEAHDIMLTVKFGEKTWINTFKSDMTVSVVRDECCHHFSIAKTKYRDHTLLKDNKDLVVVGRATIGGKLAIKAGTALASGSTVFLVMYNK